MNIKFSQTVKNAIQSAIVILVTVVVSPVYAELANPQVLLEQATTATFKRIELDKQNIASDPDHLRVIIEQELMPYIDHKFAAFKVLGKDFRSVPKNKIPEYVDEFKEYLVTSFASVLGNYGGQELLFEPVKNTENNNSMTVKAIIRDAGHPDINISFKLRKAKNSQEWKTYDLVAEGISLLSSKQSEFASIIRQQGIQAVIDEMRSKNGKPLNISSNVKLN